MKIPEFILSSGLDRALGWTVLHSLWQGTLIAFLAGILLIALQRKTAQTRYLVANLALLTLFCTSIGTFFWYLKSTPTDDFSKEKLEAQAVFGKNENPGFDKNLAAPTLQNVPNPAVPETQVLGNFKDYFNQNLPLVVLIWFAGMAIFLLKLMGSIVQVNNLRRRMNFHADPFWADLLEKLGKKSGFRQKIDLFESALVRSPLTIGHLKPVILFPIGILNRLPEPEVEAILAHELAHILRRDYFFNILQSLMEAIFYFHPAVWWLSGQVRKERENACDDRAIELLGNKINYAKALVTVQEMAFFPLSPALAFAGTRKNQLLARVQRLFSQPKSSFNFMEKWISTALAVCLVLVLAIGQRFQNAPQNLSGTENVQQNSGVWQAEFKNDTVYLNFSSREKQGYWARGDVFLKNAFTNLVVADGETKFEMNRPAGRILFVGKIEGNSGYGKFEFKPDENYRAALKKELADEVDDELIMQCFLANFPADYVKKVKNLGFKSVSKDELQQLAAFKLDEKSIEMHKDLAASLDKKDIGLDEIVQMEVSGITPEKVKRLSKTGLENLGFDEITQMSMHHVEPEFIEEMNALGFGKLSGEDLLAAKIHGIDKNFVQKCRALNLEKLNFEDVMALKIHGVDEDFIKKAQNMGFGKLNFEDLMSLKIHEIDEDFVKKAQNMGFGKLNLDDVMSLKIHGIDEEFIKNAQNMGFGKLSLDDVMSLKIHEIDEDFVKNAQNMGFGKLTLDDVMSLKIHEIDEEFLKNAQNMGFEKLSLDDVMSLKIHGIDEEFIKTAQNMGFGKLSLDDVMSLKIHGIDSDFLKNCNGLGLGKLTFDEVMGLKIHDINSEFVKSYREIGFKNLTVEDVMSAKIHGVTPEFIKESEKKGYKFPSLEEYSDLKIRSEWRGKNSN